jgi:hypothetical protein
MEGVKTAVYPLKVTQAEIVKPILDLPRSGCPVVRSRKPGLNHIINEDMHQTVQIKTMFKSAGPTH